MCGIYWAYQHKFFFQPKVLDANHVFNFPTNSKYVELKIPFDSSNIIDVVKFEPLDSPAKGVVLFFHGNKSNVEHYAAYAPFFTNKGYECWMPDYPGYGRSTGELTIENLQQLATQLYKMAKAKFPENSIVIYGKSLGTGIASYLAAKYPCKELVLETPYSSLQEVVANYLFFMPTQLLTKYNLGTTEYLDRINTPITILHGNNDELIPLSNAAHLLKFMKPKDAFYVFEKGKHNTLSQFDLYKKVVDSLLVK